MKKRGKVSSNLECVVFNWVICDLCLSVHLMFIHCRNKSELITVTHHVQNLHKCSAFHLARTTARIDVCSLSRVMLV
jgi:hypothetical protein